MAEHLELVANDILQKIRDENARHRGEIANLESLLAMATKGVAVGATLAYEDGGTLLIQSVDVERRKVSGVYSVTRSVAFDEIATLWSKIND